MNLFYHCSFTRKWLTWNFCLQWYSWIFEYFKYLGLWKWKQEWGALTRRRTLRWPVCDRLVWASDDFDIRSVWYFHPATTRDRTTPEFDTCRWKEQINSLSVFESSFKEGMGDSSQNQLICCQRDWVNRAKMTEKGYDMTLRRGQQSKTWWQ